MKLKELKDYPSELTESRVELEGAFIFSLWNDPDLYSDFRKINIDDKSRTILTEEGQFYFQLGKNLYEQGYRKFDHVTLMIYLESFPKVREQFDMYGGYNTVRELMSVHSADNVDGYFDNVAKYNTLMKL